MHLSLEIMRVLCGGLAILFTIPSSFLFFFYLKIKKKGKQMNVISLLVIIFIFISIIIFKNNSFYFISGLFLNIVILLAI